VENYGEAYVCAGSCLKQLKLANGSSVKLTVEEGTSIIRAMVVRNGRSVKNPKVDLCDMRIYGLPCLATFAGSKGELIVLLR
jgi:hypothetical protein